MSKRDLIFKKVSTKILIQCFSCTSVINNIAYIKCVSGVSSRWWSSSALLWTKFQSNMMFRNNNISYMNLCLLKYIKDYYKHRVQNNIHNFKNLEQ